MKNNVTLVLKKTNYLKSAKFIVIPVSLENKILKKTHIFLLANVMLLLIMYNFQM